MKRMPVDWGAPVFEGEGGEHKISAIDSFYCGREKGGAKSMCALGAKKASFGLSFASDVKYKYCSADMNYK